MRLLDKTYVKEYKDFHGLDKIADELRKLLRALDEEHYTNVVVVRLTVDVADEKTPDEEDDK